MIKINKIVKYLILADIAFWTGWGLITPVFAIFIVEKIQGGSALVVGIATAIYWILRALLIFPIGTLLDKYDGDRDDYLFLVTGNFVSALVLFGYIFAIYPWHVYMLQLFYGLGMAMSIAGWRSIFTKKIDKGKEATEWALDDMFISLGCGIAGLVSGWIVTIIGFNQSFLVAGFFGILSTLALLGLRKEISGVFNRGFHANIRDIFKR
ncbi:MAG: MFS transporter [Candidatus Pacebacteria bacterium]|nr:MFS transporter [Candidatus Paceibacterota bacterium]